MKGKALLERLDARERRLLRVLLGVTVAIILVLLPLATQAYLGTERAGVDAIRSALQDISDARGAIAKADAARATVTRRYARTTPALPTFLDGLAKQSGLEVPETQERPTVPHGKRFEERATRIELRKVGLLNLSRFLEKIERSGHPVVVSKLNLRKRLSEPDSYDVELIVSAFDRKESPKPAATGSVAPKKNADDTDAEGDEEAEP